MSAPLLVRVGATSANLGSGFDVIGLALNLYDEVRCTRSSQTSVIVHGEGADQLPVNEDHLVLRSLRTGLRALGARADVGITLECHNAIPHARGLGSSAAAAVAGFALACGLAQPDQELDRVWVARQAALVEGHPDNAFAAALGGAVLAWAARGGDPTDHVGVTVSDALRARVWIPSRRVPTGLARAVLPKEIDRREVTAQTMSLALLVEALRGRFDLLLAGTQPSWHQRSRAHLMPESAALVDALRAHQVAATISGAGPSVIALGTPAQLDVAAQVPAAGFDVREWGVGNGVRLHVMRAGQG